MAAATGPNSFYINTFRPDVNSRLKISPAFSSVSVYLNPLENSACEVEKQLNTGQEPALKDCFRFRKGAAAHTEII